MHAVALARELGISEVIVPPDPGSFSAWGMLQSAVRQDFSEAFFRDFDDLDTADMQNRFTRLGGMAFSSLVGEGVDRDRIALIQRLDMRYQGQEHTLTVTLPGGVSPSRDDRLAALRRRFEETYRARYGHSNPEAALETVNLRLTALGDVGRPLLQAGYRPDRPSDRPPPNGTRSLRYRFVRHRPVRPRRPAAGMFDRGPRHRAGSHRHHGRSTRRVGRRR